MLAGIQAVQISSFCCSNSLLNTRVVAADSYHRRGARLKRGAWEPKVPRNRHENIVDGAAGQRSAHRTPVQHLCFQATAQLKAQLLGSVAPDI